MRPLFVSIIRSLLIGYVLIVGVVLHSQAQKTSEKRENLRLIARVGTDSVVLRWAVTRPDLWRQGQQYGYFLDKAVVKNGKPKYEPFAHLKPASQAQITALYQANRTDQAVGIALATLYGNTATRITDRISDFQTGTASLNMAFGYNLLMADIMPRVADLSGLRFTDVAPKTGESRLYRLRLGSAKGSSDTCYLFLMGGKPDSLPECPTPEVFNQEKMVKLQWTFPIESFVAFHVEKSRAGRSDFFRLNQHPIQFSDERQSGPLFQASYQDTGLVNYEAWEYRLIGITSFGELIPIAQPVVGMGKDRTPVSAAVLASPICLHGGAQQLTWEWNGKQKDLAGFQLTKSVLAEGPYLPVSSQLPPNSRSFIDTQPAPNTGCYYVLEALDTAGNRAPSLPVLAFAKDSMAPLVPEWVEGVADTNGLVKLRWKSSNASDWKSFKLYRAYQQDHVFNLITPNGITDTTFTDTIVARSLTSKVYYRLTTQDLNANNSNLGPILSIKRPDLIPPVAPIITGLSREKDSIQLSFRPSSSRDVAQTWVEWRTSGQTNWKRELLPGSHPAEATVHLHILPAGQLVEVRLLATDSSGLTSPPSAWASIKIPLTPEQLIGKWETQVDTSTRKLLITWEKAFDDGEIQALISLDQQSLQTQKAVRAEAKQLSLSNLIPGKTYRLVLRLVSPQGEWLTETRLIKFQQP